MTSASWKRATGIVSLAAIGLIAWQTWVRLRPPPPIEPALQLLDAGRDVEAEALVRSCIQVDPGNATALILLGRIEADRLDRGVAVDPATVRQTLNLVRRARAENPRLSALGHYGEGVLCECLGRLDEAEAAWRESIRLDPTANEPSRRLIELLTIQGRTPAIRDLAMRQYRAGRNVHARLQALLTLVRVDVHHPASVEVIRRLTPIVRENPREFYSALALGRALAREGQPDLGQTYLRAAFAEHPDNAEAADAFLSALEDAGQVDAVEELLQSLRLKTDPTTESLLARHRGWVALERNRPADAARDFQIALRSTPDDPRLRYRLGRALRLANDPSARDHERQARTYTESTRALRSFYEQTLKTLNDGALHPDLDQQYADLLESMGRLDEARAWHALALKARPDDPRSLAALERLKGH